MKTTYLIWKDHSCAGINSEWQEMTGQAFYAFVRSPEAKGRYFIKLPSTHADGSDGAYVVEVTKDDYRQWKREKNHIDYLNRDAKPYMTFSYHAMESEDGENYGEELLADDSDVEFNYIKSQEPEMLKAGLSLLSDDERLIIEFLYLSEIRGTVRDYEKQTGVPKSTVNRKQITALEKLRKFFVG